MQNVSTIKTRSEMNFFVKILIKLFKIIFLREFSRFFYIHQNAKFRKEKKKFFLIILDNIFYKNKKKININLISIILLLNSF